MMVEHPISEPLNCLAKHSKDQVLWSAMERRGDKFYSHDGLLITPPIVWRDVTIDEIKEEYKRTGTVLVGFK